MKMTSLQLSFLQTMFHNLGLSLEYESNRNVVVMANYENWNCNVLIQFCIQFCLDSWILPYLGISSKNPEETVLEFLNTTIQKMFSCLYVDIQSNSKSKEDTNPQRFYTSLWTYKKHLLEEVNKSSDQSDSKFSIFSYFMSAVLHLCCN